MMQRDMKVGLALGVALVGIVGALFFRRDALPEDPSPPALLGAEEIDQQISEKAKAPYIQGLDEDPADAPPVPPPATAASAKPKAKSDDIQVPSFLTKEDEADHRTFLSGKSAAAPDPIAPVGNPSRRETAGVPEPAPAHNRDWEPTGAAPPASSKERPSRSTAGNSDAGASRRTHVIQPGDTLSGIANRYLGSSARYREVYEANRHVLRSPDDLPEGTQLVIPEIGSRSTVARPVSTQNQDPVDALRDRGPSEQTRPSRETREPAVSGEFQSGGGLRFAPVRRGPFSAGRASSGQPGSSERPAAPTGEARPGRRPQSRPQLEIDDSDPF